MKTLDHSLTRYWFYVLYSLKDKKLYKGTCADIGARFLSHQNGANASTRHRRPFVLIFAQSFDTKKEALAYERFSKTLEGGTQLNDILIAAGNDITNEDDHTGVKTKVL